MGRGSSSPSYEAEYRWYSNPPRPYEGQNEINNAANNINNQSQDLINGRIRPNESSLRYYQNMNIYYMQLKDQTDAQIDWFLERYPDTVVERIVNIEKVFERINEYIQEANSGVYQNTYEKTLNVYKNISGINNKIQEYIDTQKYFAAKMRIKAEIESALHSYVTEYINSMNVKIEQSDLTGIENLQDYVSTNGKIYIGLPA